MGSLGSGVGTFWSAKVLSRAVIEEDRDRGITMETNQSFPPSGPTSPQPSDHTRSPARWRCLRLQDWQASSFRDLKLRSQKAIRGDPILLQEEIPDPDGLDRKSCQKMRKGVKRNIAHKVAQPDQHRMMTDGAGDGCGKAVTRKFLLGLGSAIAQFARFS
uniref:Uncharacterized protein n=1 Tax=Peronospora matthiolae TaxID=2874970 RepID=A0AAV1VDK8_9STRA